MKNNSISLKCYAIIPADKHFNPIREVLNCASKKSNVQLIAPGVNIHEPGSSYTNIMNSDLILADVSENFAPTLYELGLAHSQGKPTALLVEDISTAPFDLQHFFYIQYHRTKPGLSKLENDIHRLFIDYAREPGNFQRLFPYFKWQNELLYNIEPGNLSPRKFENLCFELMTQMDFQQVKWEENPREIDITAVLPKEDPYSYYDYREFFAIFTGTRFPVDDIFEKIRQEPRHFLDQLSKDIEGLENLFEEDKIRTDIGITLLVISREEITKTGYLKKSIAALEKRLNEVQAQTRVRVLTWEKPYLIKLIKQHPQIAFKYFSEAARNGSGYRKTTRELYLENVEMTTQLEVTKNALEEEKKKRFMAERNAAWKDVAFRAAHKLGNPVDAVDTFLQGLRKRIPVENHRETEKILSDMDASIEECKQVIAQFKSLIKSQEIKQRQEELLPLLRPARRLAEEKGVMVTVKPKSGIPRVLVDAERITECFNELAANSLHWLDKPQKKIKITITRPAGRSLPPSLERDQPFLKICFKDNGSGVPMDKKEKIFAPFYSTYVKGTGLGLSMVKSIIEAHGGAIYENGKPGEGASFDVYLPGIKIKKGK